MTVAVRYERIDNPPWRWRLLENYTYTSPRYGKSVQLSAGDLSDGATGAFDIHSCSWWVHDRLCLDACWADGSPCTAWQAATVLYDILKAEGRWVRAHYWRLTTFAFGCHETRRNGWW
jgi:hypothetical protein